MAFILVLREPNNLFRIPSFKRVFWIVWMVVSNNVWRDVSINVLLGMLICSVSSSSRSRVSVLLSPVATRRFSYLCEVRRGQLLFFIGKGTRTHTMKHMAQSSALGINPFTPKNKTNRPLVRDSTMRVHLINIKFPVQLHQKYYITQYEGLGFS